LLRISILLEIRMKLLLLGVNSDFIEYHFAVYDLQKIIF
jgi:hypothetical protein